MEKIAEYVSEPSVVFFVTFYIHASIYYVECVCKMFW